MENSAQWGAAQHRRGSSKLRSQVIRGLVIAMLLPTLALAMLFAVFEYRSVERQQQDRLRLAVRLTAVSIDQFVDSHASAVALVAKSAKPDQTASDLEELRTLFPAFVTALKADATGAITSAAPAARASGATRRSVADRDYFKIPAEEGE